MSAGTAVLLLFILVATLALIADVPSRATDRWLSPPTCTEFSPDRGQRCIREPGHSPGHIQVGGPVWFTEPPATSGSVGSPS